MRLSRRSARTPTAGQQRGFSLGGCAARWARLDQWVLGWMVLACLTAFAWGGDCNLPRTGDIVVENNCNQRTQVSVNGSLRVAGRGASRPELTAGTSNRFFYLGENTELTLDFVTLSGGGSRGYGKSWSACGGGDLARSYDTCSGGQINALVSTRIDIRNCIFKGAKAKRGGSISFTYRIGTPSGSRYGHLHILNSQFQSLEAAEGGGAIHLIGISSSDAFTYNITNSRFDSCRVHSRFAQQGGALRIDGFRGTISASSFHKCSVTAEGDIRPAAGGALMLSSRNTNISSTSFTDNVAKHGGNPTDNLTTSGGAIHVDSLSNVRIVDSTFEGNTAVGSAYKEHGRGGALYCRSQSTVSVLSSHFESNTAEAGGAIAVGGTASMTNVSLILNRGVAGSAILNQGRLKLRGGVIANNSLGQRPPKLQLINDYNKYSMTGCTAESPCKIGNGHCTLDSGCFGVASCELGDVLLEKNFSTEGANGHYLGFCYLPNAGALATSTRDITYLHNIAFSGNSPGDVSNLGGNPAAIRETPGVNAVTQVLPSSRTHRYADDYTLTDSCDSVSTVQLCMDLGFTKCDDTSSTRCSCPITTYHENDMRGSAANVCTSCDAGSYGDEPGLVGRGTMCPAGYHTALVGQALCLPCLPGKFGNKTGLAVPRVRPWQDERGAQRDSVCGLPGGVLPGPSQPGVVPALSARKSSATKQGCILAPSAPKAR